MMNRQIVFFLMFLGFSIHAIGQETKEFRLISKLDFKPQYEMWDGTKISLMGYTSKLGDPISLPSPTIFVNQGDSVVLHLYNFSQGAPHTIHLHGLDVNQENDGVPGLSKVVEHSGSFYYRFKATHAGTYLYHCHVASPVHVQAGMYGLIIVKEPGGANYTWESGYRYNKEYSWLMSEVDTNWHTSAVLKHKYDTQSPLDPIPTYKPQYFLVNGKSDTQINQATTKIEAHKSDEVYLRLANIGNLANRITFPKELNPRIVSTDGREISPVEKNQTLEVYPGERYGVLISSKNDLLDSIQIEYFNLNTGSSDAKQFVEIDIKGVNGITLPKDPVSKIWLTNPSSAIVKFRLTNASEPKTVYILDMNGRIVKMMDCQAGHAELMTIDIHDLENGLYIFQVRDKISMSNYKMVIKH